MNGTGLNLRLINKYIFMRYSCKLLKDLFLNEIICGSRELKDVCLLRIVCFKPSNPFID